jgi:hypothetical protein
MAEGKPLRHERDFNALKNRYGIKDVDWGEANQLERHIRPVVPIDDARHLVMPAAVPDCVFGVVEAAAVGLFSGCEITVLSPGGCMLWASSLAPDTIMMTQFLLTLTPTGLQEVAQVRGFDGSDVQTTVFSGTAPGAPAPAGPRLCQFAMVTPWLPMHFETGRRIQFWRATVNVPLEVNIRIREIA